MHQNMKLEALLLACQISSRARIVMATEGTSFKSLNGCNSWPNRKPNDVATNAKDSSRFDPKSQSCTYILVILYDRRICKEFRSENTDVDFFIKMKVDSIMKPPQ